MLIKGKLKIRIFSILTILFFLGSTFGVHAQDVPAMPSMPSTTNSPDLSSLMGGNSGLNILNGNIDSLQNSLTQIDAAARPLYNAIAPSNMEAMSVAERIRAIVGNTQNAVKSGVQSYQAKVSDYNAQNGITPNTSFEKELGVGLRELGAKAGQLPLNGKGNALIEKLKSIISAIKDKLQALISVIRAKVAAIAQKIGLSKKKDTEAKEPEKESTGEEPSQPAPNAEIQYADTFSGKLQKGVTEGAKNAKASLKNSFSFTNLAITTGVSVGTNLALQIARGEKPSFGKAAKAVASVEFAGSVVGGALGAAGGQFASTLVKTFMPGPIGSLIGAFVPVLTGSIGAQMGSSMAGGIKGGSFSISRAWQSIDKVDLLGSSIGSTIGMALGAPIPILGPIIGGIVGGFLGAKVAKWIHGFAKGRLSIKGIFTPGSQVGPQQGVPTRGGEVSIGDFSQPAPTTYNPNIPRGTTTVSNEVSVSASSGNIRDAERKYYETYLQYNRLVEDGKYDDAKKVYTDLKAYSDQYNALKQSVKTQ